MNMSHCNDAQVSRPNDSGGKIAYDSRQQSLLRNPQPTSIGSSFDFKKPRFSERNSYPRIPLSVNRSKLRIPFKSELCMLFQRGRCYYGENCHYAHSVSEIGKAGFNTVATEEHLNDGSKRNDICAARECRWFSCGTICPYGDNCHYLHKIDQKVRRDVGFNRQRDAVSGVNGVIDRSGSAQIQCLSLNASEVFRKAAWKTKLCAKWEMFGNCHHEARCTYAHGIAGGVASFGLSIQNMYFFLFEIDFIALFQSGILPC